MNLKEGTLRERKAKYVKLMEKRSRLRRRKRGKERKKLVECVIPEGDSGFGKRFSGKWVEENERR